MNHASRMRIPEKENNQRKAPEGLAWLECLTTERRSVCPVQNEDKQVGGTRPDRLPRAKSCRPNALIFPLREMGSHWRVLNGRTYVLRLAAGLRMD